MTVELIFILLLFASGAGLVRALGFSEWAGAGLGFLVGVCAFVSWGTIQICLGLPTQPVVTLALTASSALAAAIYRRALFAPWRRFALALAIGAGLITLVVLVVYEVNLVKWHTDSFRYLMIGSLIAENRLEEVAPSVLVLRLPAVSILHAPANIAGELYLRSATPLTALSVFAALVWLLREARRPQRFSQLDWLVLGAAVLLLLTTNRFVWNAFYLNGHLLFGALTMLIAGCGWLMHVSPVANPRALAFLQAVALPALVLSRVEGSFGAAIALLPALFCARLAWRDRAMLLAVFGASVALWHGFVIYFHVTHGLQPPSFLYALLGLGLGSIAITPVLAWRPLTERPLLFTTLAEAALLLSLAAGAVVDPTVLITSVRVSLHNFGGGGAWGVTPIYFAILIATAFLFCREKGLSYLRLTVTASVTLYLVIAYLRGGPYRIGEGDSLNRMLIQIIPLAVLFLAAAAMSRNWGLPFVKERAATATQAS